MLVSSGVKSPNAPFLKGRQWEFFLKEGKREFFVKARLRGFLLTGDRGGIRKPQR